VTVQLVGIPRRTRRTARQWDTLQLLESAPTLADVGNVAVFAASHHAAAITATAINITCGAEVD
jgi:enoyl-[acyl-carrier-protein] reductase (NADH)